MLATWSSSLALCISISAHHIGGRPTKTSESEQAVHQYPPKHLKSSVDQGMKGEKSRVTKIQLWRRKGCMKMFVVRVFVPVGEREDVEWRKTARCISPGLWDTLAVWDEWCCEKWWEGDAVRAASRWMDDGKWDVVSPAGESCLAPARPEI